MNKLIFTLALLFLVACAPQVQQPLDGINHTGCQEGEIDINGKCTPAQANNVDLFSKDTSQVEAIPASVGYFVQPSQPGDYPGVVMIHEWWGLNDNIKRMADILASEGYLVIAVDLYDGEVATTSDEAARLATQVRENPQEALDKMREAVTFLENRGASNIASLGWCFGGQQSLQLSLNEGLDATVIYYGHLVDDQSQLRSVSSPVLGIFGSEDSSIPPEKVRSFESSLNALSVPNQIYIYEGVGHAFANPSGSNYAEKQTRDAWAKTLAFLNENLKAVNDFESCVAAGNAVMESYPRQCRHENTTYTEDMSAGTVLAGTQEEQCISFGGEYLAEHNECEGISQEACQELGGTFNECASACRHNPEADFCTLQCVAVCVFT